MVTKVRDIEEALETFNDMIKESGLEVTLGQRYGYKALDLYNKNKESMESTIVTGLSSGDALEYIRAMVKGCELCEKKLKEVM